MPRRDHALDCVVLSVHDNFTRQNVIFSIRIPVVIETRNAPEGVQIVQDLVADCLALDVAQVHPQSRLINDLGADSLDFVDLIFTLEKRFGIRLRENDLNTMSRMGTSSRDSAGLEFLPLETVSRLSTWLPELATIAEPTTIRPAEVLPLITIEALWRLVDQKMKAASTAS